MNKVSSYTNLHNLRNLNKDLGAIMGNKMRAAQISKAGGEWELVEHEVPEPTAGQVRVKVEA